MVIQEFFFFKQKTAYDMRISDWSSDVCSSDLSKLVQLGLEQQRMDHQRQIAVQEQNARRARASMAGVSQQIAQARAEAIREVLADLAKAEADVRLAREDLTKADQRSRLQVVRAPAEGIVPQQHRRTPGGERGGTG